MKSKVILWDWKEQPPIVEIVKTAQKIEGAKLWQIDEGGDTNVLVIAKDKKTATKSYKKFCGSDQDEDFLIGPWSDES